MTKPHQVSNSALKEALLAVHGRKLTFRGRTWKLDVRDGISKAWRTPYFHCTAQNLTPKDESESKFCITDLWQSDSEHSVALLYKFAVLGGFMLAAPEAKAGAL